MHKEQIINEKFTALLCNCSVNDVSCVYRPSSHKGQGPSFCNRTEKFDPNAIKVIMKAIQLSVICQIAVDEL